MNGQPPKNQGHRNTARAPYNFVPLNKEVISVGKAQGFDSFPGDRCNGYIDLSLTAKTPLFIRGNDADFLRKVGKPVIPGSSIRGMVRNLVEIVSWSKMDPSSKDKPIFYRNVTDANYRHQFSKYASLRAGWIQVKATDHGNRYLLVPAEKIKGQPYLRAKSDPMYSVRKVSFKPNDARHNKLNEVYPKGKYQDNGYLIVTGNFNKKKYQWLVGPPQKQKGNEVTHDVTDIVDQERHDLSRAKENSIKWWIDHLKDNKDIEGFGTPCFYLQDKRGAIKGIGTTGFFRLPYRNTVRDFLTEGHRRDYDKRDGDVDMAHAIFGSSEFAGRVFFEDGTAVHYEQAEKEQTPKILSSPKITTYQHYLTRRTDGRPRSWNDKNQSIDPNALIRGFKKYWHKQPQQWWDHESKTSNPSPIKPVLAGSVFQARVRFENLSPPELGCLLFILTLPGANDCCHKLGMGKPLGLGSVEIKADLTLIDRKKRYQSLFSENNSDWETGSSFNEGMNHYLEAFYTFLQENVKEFDTADPWKNARLKELKTMLTFDHKLAHWQDITRYMEIERQVTSNNGDKGKINEFAKRPVLKTPSEVINDQKKN